MNFNTAEFRKFREDFQEAVRSVEEKYALTIEAGNITYSADTFTYKVTCAKTDAGDLKQKEFERYCASYGFSKDDYKREFVLNGDRYAFVGISAKSYARPCICTNLGNNKQYKLSAEHMKRVLEIKDGAK